MAIIIITFAARNLLFRNSNAFIRKQLIKSVMIQQITLTLTHVHHFFLSFPENHKCLKLDQ